MRYMHDWTEVPDGIFQAFHHGWIWAISDDLNSGRLPRDYYALPEQVAAGLGSDVLTLQDRRDVGPAAAPLPDMPLFIEPNLCVNVQLEPAYQLAYRAMPRRWREVLGAGEENELD
jgi:hypothetical protein